MTWMNVTIRILRYRTSTWSYDRSFVTACCIDIDHFGNCGIHSLKSAKDSGTFIPAEITDFKIRNSGNTSRVIN